MSVDCSSAWVRMMEDGCCWVVVVVVWPCLLLCSDALVSFSVVFVGFGVCVWWVCVVLVGPLGAWLSVDRLVESVAVSDILRPQIVPARLGLKGGWIEAGGVEERGLSVV